MTLIICIVFLLLFLVARALLKQKPSKPAVSYPAKKISPAEVDQAVTLLNKKHSVAEVIEQAQEKEPVYLWHLIDHLSEAELMQVVTALNKTKLRRWFNYQHNKEYYHFPAKVYALIQAKLNDEEWLSDEEYKKNHTTT